MCFGERAQQLRDAASGWIGIAVDDANLIGIGAAILAHRERFPAPDQLRPALPEMLPASNRVLARLATRRPIPSFHRMDAPAVADAKSVDIDRLRERASIRRAEDLLIARQ